MIFPSRFDSHAKSLIRRLLHPNPSLRIGCLQNGCQDVKDHAFFESQNVNFFELLSKSAEVSFKPSVDETEEAKFDFDIDDELSRERDAKYADLFKGLSNSSFNSE